MDPSARRLSVAASPSVMATSKVRAISFASRESPSATAPLVFCFRVGREEVEVDQRPIRQVRFGVEDRAALVVVPSGSLGEQHVIPARRRPGGGGGRASAVRVPGMPGNDGPAQVPAAATRAFGYLTGGRRGGRSGRPVRPNAP